MRNRMWLCTTVAVLSVLLAACAGGGGGTPGGAPSTAGGGQTGSGDDSGGGNEDPLIVDESVVVSDSALSVPAVQAEGPTDTFADTRSRTFPTSSADGPSGTKRATVSRASDGSLSIVYDTPARTRRIDFSAGDLVNSEDGLNVYERGLHNYFEFSASTDAEPFDYMRVGLLFKLDPADFWVRALSYGYVTPPERMKEFGSARYEGSATGFLQLGSGFDPTKFYFLDADTTLSVAFGTGTFTGGLTSIVAENFDGEALSTVPEISFSGIIPIDSSHLGGQLQISGNGGTIRGSGNIGGRFYGPGAQEIGGHWNGTVTGLSEPGSLWGMFGASRTGASLRTGEFFTAYRGSNWTLTQTSVLASGSGSSATTQPITSPATTLIATPDGGITMRRASGGTIASFGFDDIHEADRASQFIGYHAIKGNTELLLGAGLDYSTFGVWTEPDAVTPSSTRYHFFSTGISTPIANVPSSGIGTYRGTGHGIVSSPEGVSPIALNTMISINFAQRNVSGILNRRDGAPFYQNASGGIIGGLVATGTLSGNAVSATVSAQSASVPVTGALTGKLYGPAAQELAGHWSIDAPDLGYKASGSFGSKR